MNVPDELAIEKRREDAWGLYVKGMTYRDISRIQGVSLGTVASDMKALMERTQSETDEKVAREKQRMLDRNDWQVSELLKLADADPDKFLSVCDRLDAVHARRAKLLGLDAATKQELSGPEGAPIEINARDALVERLAGLIAGETAGATAQGDSGPTESGGSESP